MALAADRNTPWREGEVLAFPVAAAVKCFAGGIAALDAGYVKPGEAATGLVYLGRFEETVDNLLGSDGDKTVRVRRGLVFQWNNSSTDAIDQADVGASAYIEDDETLAATNGGGTLSAAGQILAVDADGVWIQ